MWRKEVQTITFIVILEIHNVHLWRRKLVKQEVDTFCLSGNCYKISNVECKDERRICGNGQCVKFNAWFICVTRASRTGKHSIVGMSHSFHVLLYVFMHTILSFPKHLHSNWICCNKQKEQLAIGSGICVFLFAYHLLYVEGGGRLTHEKRCVQSCVCQASFFKNALGTFKYITSRCMYPLCLSNFPERVLYYYLQLFRYTGLRFESLPLILLTHSKMIYIWFWILT